MMEGWSFKVNIPYDDYLENIEYWSDDEILRFMDEHANMLIERNVSKIQLGNFWEFTIENNYMVLRRHNNRIHKEG